MNYLQAVVLYDVETYIALRCPILDVVVINIATLFLLDHLRQGTFRAT